MLSPWYSSLLSGAGVSFYILDVGQEAVCHFAV